jgi:hypothetical protein
MNTGKPFAYRYPPTTGQYYLVDFADPKAAFQKTKGVSIYNTDVLLKQRRINGETIFVVPDVAGNYFNEATHNSPSAGDWGNHLVLGQYLTATGGVTFAANPQNGHNTVRLNGTSGYLSQTFANTLDIIVALKVRAPTFANNGGFAHGAANIIRGTSAGTKWQNPSLTGFEYSMNGVSYAVADMQAPMDTWGVCHFHFATPVSITEFGRDLAGTAFLPLDFGDMILSDGELSRSIAKEAVEFMMIKYGVTT